MFLAELSYWSDINNDEDQAIWMQDGGLVNVFGKVFGCGAGSDIGGYRANAINNNNYKTFSPPLMAGFLGDFYRLRRGLTGLI